MNPILYVHGGSGNHGCEAIARTLTQCLRSISIDPTILTANLQEDVASGLCEDVKLIPLSSNVNKFGFSFAHAYLMNKLFKRYIYLDMLPRMKQIQRLNGYDTAIAIGGDTYSYSYSEANTYMHKVFIKKGMKTILWGASIDPTLMDDSRVMADLRDFDLITARESITYKALINHGLKKVCLIPDMAFSLKTEPADGSADISPNDTVGINLSPLVIDYQNGENITLNNYRKLIEYILSTTTHKIALIPHVVWPSSDDRKVLQQLFSEYSSSGRMIFVQDQNCMKLKDSISRCRMFVCARTHASIAAYSTCVPTLVIGYSVKARGLAQDIWGSPDSYILPVQSLKTEYDLVNSYKLMEATENEMRDHLKKIMPTYKKNLSKAISVLKDFQI